VENSLTNSSLTFSKVLVSSKKHNPQLLSIRWLDNKSMSVGLACSHRPVMMMMIMMMMMVMIMIMVMMMVMMIMIMLIMLLSQ
jgi:hypothetical protein